MPVSIHFVADAPPSGKGSKGVFFAKAGRCGQCGRGKPIVMDVSNKGAKLFEAAIKDAARHAVLPRRDVKWPYPYMVIVEVIFLVPMAMKPTDHLKHYPLKPPDIDKMLRCTLDAMTGIVYEDDKQVCGVRMFKQYGEPPRAAITVELH